VKARIHVNQHIVKRNKRQGTNDPPITVKTYKSNLRCQSVRINGPAKLTGVHDGQRPLGCGATIWIEAEFDDLEIA
jgi:hypothetical protein